MKDKLKIRSIRMRVLALKFRHGDDQKARKPADQVPAREVDELIVPELKRATQSEEKLKVPSLDKMLLRAR